MASSIKNEEILTKQKQTNKANIIRVKFHILILIKNLKLQIKE